MRTDSRTAMLARSAFLPSLARFALPWSPYDRLPQEINHEHSSDTRRAVELLLRRRALYRRGRGTGDEWPDVRAGHRASQSHPALSDRDDSRYGPDWEQLHCCAGRATGLGA